MKWWYYIIFYLVSQLVAGLAGALLTTLLHLDSTIVMVVSLVLAQLLAIGLVLVFKPAWLHAADDRNRLTVLALLMALPIIVLVNLMMEILPEAPNILDESFSQIIYNPIGMLTIAVLGPVSEELLFRAGVLGGLLKRDAERNAERSTFNVQRSMFNVQRSTFNVQRSPLARHHVECIALFCRPSESGSDASGFLVRHLVRVGLLANRLARGSLSHSHPEQRAGCGTGVDI